MQELLDVAAGRGRGVEKHDATGFAAAVLPGMRDVARHERAGAGPADGDFVADHEGDLAGEHPRDLVAVAMEMEQTLAAGWQRFLEQHDAAVGLVTEELQRGEAAGCRHVEKLSAAGGDDKAFGRVHADVLSAYRADPSWHEASRLQLLDTVRQRHGQ